MRILVTNDDGIDAPGIWRLAKAAKEFGDVTVVAPDCQYSAMSHRITIEGTIEVREISDFPVSGVRAYQVGGTPADCVKIAVEYLLDEPPELVLSGVNKGLNAGIDIMYSGTVAAAMEALLKGIPAVAFSKVYDDDYSLVDDRLCDILRQVLAEPAGKGKIWNVNFPAGGPESCKGVLWERTIAKAQVHSDRYELEREEGCSRTLVPERGRTPVCEEDTDLYALFHGYISIGTVSNVIMSQ